MSGGGYCRKNPRGSAKAKFRKSKSSKDTIVHLLSVVRSMVDLPACRGPVTTATGYVRSADSSAARWVRSKDVGKAEYAGEDILLF